MLRGTNLALLVFAFKMKEHNVSRVFCENRMSRKNLVLGLGVQTGQNRARIEPKLTFLILIRKPSDIFSDFFAKSYKHLYKHFEEV